jgi:hypothetical protein
VEGPGLEVADEPAADDRAGSGALVVGIRNP